MVVVPVAGRVLVGRGIHGRLGLAVVGVQRGHVRDTGAFMHGVRRIARRHRRGGKPRQHRRKPEGQREYK